MAVAYGGASAEDGFPVAGIWRWKPFSCALPSLGGSINLAFWQFLRKSCCSDASPQSATAQIECLGFVAVFLTLTLWLIHQPKTNTFPATRQTPKREWIKNLHNFWLFQPLRSFAQLLPLPFRHEVVIVIWILVALFWLASWQGTTDAFRDAVNETSTRPIITLVSTSDKLTLGRNLDDLLTNPSLKGSRIIGDVEQFKRILGRETNDTTDPKQPIIWRLLIENSNWVYLFPAMPSGAKPNQRPPVLVINAGDGGVRLLILSRPKLG